MDRKSLGLTYKPSRYILGIYRVGGVDMITAIKKWGNSQGLRFSREILEKLDILIDDEVNVEVIDQKIVITKAYPTKIDIRELFKNYNEDYKGEEYDWGMPVGEEIW